MAVAPMADPKHSFEIRLAIPLDAPCLTRVANASKRHWQYPEQYYEIWKEELTITPGYIVENTVFVLEINQDIIAFYSLKVLEQDLRFKSVLLEKGTWLDHMFITPEHIGRGLGKQMFNHLCRWCRSRGITQVHLLADPHASGFYENMGGSFVRQVPSTIPGRTTPQYEIVISG